MVSERKGTRMNLGVSVVLCFEVNSYLPDAAKAKESKISNFCFIPLPNNEKDISLS
jgi:hypothetical protein